ncbi:hypothetical protein TREMEDRAFT_37565 [Tremella mesenterica DSM 1558]|uniref:uncharacterized protein n=1 Tax=Tremella mesenterica (strain ATCC 24925 / CBS 8224 / DSM 1558 / NBRC 9311 / NRRL Y-6157 / RJB 2259-6 / UBC 559-6) TaxID=578456 RepID=UPI0003F49F50|nr:uncharacterized protein TREMEDRAFT_37565 [Tremella mesenterica DSM 1558]EIW71105.1 hypothetical protein TREMEDRAFT_37565 [Tremella mesenterica DSM 1558]
MHAFFIPDDIRRMVQARQTATYARPPQEISLKLPDEVSSYHNLIPIGLAMPPRSQVYGYPSPIYKAISSVDGNVYALRRIAGYKVTSEQAFSTVERWQRLRHPNVVCLREAFTTKVFDDDSLIMVYDYHPESNTMYDEHLASDMTNRFIPIFPRRRTGMSIPERLLWSYITQIANALKAIHVSNLAARVLDPSKILITGKNRIRLNACGVVDVIGQDQGVSLAQQQEEDLVMFGMLILTLTCEFFSPGVPLAAPLDWIARHYTADFKLFISALVNRQLRHIDEVIREIGPRILNELDASFRYNDQLESDLGGEVENGRLVRLMTKLSFVNERKEFERDPRWSETGDRYILKLFRDHVFHSTGTDGTPVLDLSHVLTCLNKLDAGTEERVMLVSRDEQSCLVVSYRELKACVEGTYNELRLASSIISNPTLVSNTPLRR